MRWSFASYGQHPVSVTIAEVSLRIDMLQCGEVA